MINNRFWAWLGLVVSGLFLSGFLLPDPAFAHGMSDADKYKALYATPWQMVELGASHMLSGYDHLLFLFGVCFFLSKFKEVVKYVSVFTLGHSLTLLFATTAQIQANHYLIDAIIALTVIYKGFDNLNGFNKYLGVTMPNMLFMVFVFGLIHGFGLSTRLQMLTLPEQGLVEKILLFNAGVELGQVVALSAMVLLLAGWRKTSSFNAFSKVSNVLLMLAGLGLFIMQIYDYSTDAHLSEAAHQHNELYLPR